MINVKMVLLRLLVVILYVMYLLGWVTIITPILYWIITGMAYADFSDDILDIVEDEYRDRG